MKKILLISLVLLITLICHAQIGESYYSIGSTNMTKTPNENDVSGYLPKNVSVMVLDAVSINSKIFGNQIYFKINYNGSTGWVIGNALKSNIEINKIRNITDSLNYQKQKNKHIADSLKQHKEHVADSLQLVVFKKYKSDLIKKYGSSIAQKIIDKKIWLGMTSRMCEESWGYPDHINRSVYSFGTHEQWVYGDTYVYFEDGVLTSWQDTR